MRALRIALETAVAVVFALLIWNNFTLRRQVVAAAAPAASRGFAPGDVLPTVPATALDGSRRDLDLRAVRAVVAVADPRCESCRELLASVKDLPDVRVLSVAPLADSREGGMPATTYVVAHSLPGAIAPRFTVFPQLFVVDRGQIVRTCAKIAECR
ncbi:MAG TPA: hypothetical protein VF883_23240 [Thermoanaerobaculia bacterium]|jgi:hypothetical protein